MFEFGLLQGIILMLLLLLMLAASLWVLKILSDERRCDRIFKTMRPWWPWGDVLLRGWIRALPVGLIVWWLIVDSMLAVAMVATETIESSLGFGILAFLVFLLLVSLGVVASIMLFNRPSFAVPPHLRVQPGALSEWRGATSPHPPAAR